MNWYKVKIEFGGFPATHKTFYVYSWFTHRAIAGHNVLMNPSATRVHVEEVM